MINEDKQSLIKLTDKESLREGTKHLGAKLAFLQAHLNDGSIKFKYTETRENVADIFAKALDGAKFRDEIMLSSGGALESGTQPE